MGPIDATKNMGSGGGQAHWSGWAGGIEPADWSGLAKVKSGFATVALAHPCGLLNSLAYTAGLFLNPILKTLADRTSVGSLSVELGDASGDRVAAERSPRQ
ncbi:hypothetical protein EC9_30240 [Rosistilla ulvae]|uniref:Uncharacterized protein n=1 Tax=Rosistilla ulvae TaxID=1930277 RepID=A0A517M1X4_9BACT|nr:hypothetical protein EC9_30240 [Rosistilla ulvae]